MFFSEIRRKIELFEIIDVSRLFLLTASEEALGNMQDTTKVTSGPALPFTIILLAVIKTCS
jgi:hypothetical protein